MTIHFHQKLINFRKTNVRLLAEEGELIIVAIHRYAKQLGHDVVRSLLREREIKAKFVDEVEGHYIFNSNTFIDYISDKNFLTMRGTRCRCNVMKIKLCYFQIIAPIRLKNG